VVALSSLADAILDNKAPHTGTNLSRIGIQPHETILVLLLLFQNNITTFFADTTKLVHEHGVRSEEWRSRKKRARSRNL
jgi:hypothetical protein